MSLNKLTLTGEINKNGEFGFYNISSLKKLCKMNPNSKLIVNVSIEKSKSKNALLAIYNIETIPEIQHAFYQLGDIKSTREINEILTSLCPITKKKTLSELDYDEMVMFLDYVNNFSLENLNVVLTDPRTL